MSSNCKEASLDGAVDAFGQGLQPLQHGKGCLSGLTEHILRGRGSVEDKDKDGL